MRAIDRFCYKYERYGIRNLMLYIAIGNAIVYVFAMMNTNSQFLNLLYFSRELIMQGQIWRIITFVFIPPTDRPIFLFFALYLYYLYGKGLEREWGAMKFTLYYLSGVILTIITSLIFGGIADATYINLSIFLAFASVYPDFQILLFFILPVKVKYLAYVTVALYLLSAIVTPFPAKLLPFIALLNYFIFFYPFIKSLIKNKRFTAKNTTKFRSAVHQAKTAKGYVHKCAICGVTDTQDPNIEFRYCSRCNGYYCYCMNHINNHTHVE